MISTWEKLVVVYLNGTGTAMADHWADRAIKHTLQVGHTSLTLCVDQGLSYIIKVFLWTSNPCRAQSRQFGNWEKVSFYSSVHKLSDFSERVIAAYP